MAWNDMENETIEMVKISSVVPLIPNINVGENERLSFQTVPKVAALSPAALISSAIVSGTRSFIF